MKRLLLLPTLVLIAHSVFAQLLLDKQLQLTGASNINRQITNLGTPGAADHAVSAGFVQSGALNYGLAGGTNDYTVTLSPAPASYVTGMLVHFIVTNGNTGNATLNV